MEHGHDLRGSGGGPHDGSPFDGPLGSFLDAIVRIEDGISRRRTPLARRVEQRQLRV